MRQSGQEESAALLLSSENDDEEVFNQSKSIRTDPFPVIRKQPKTYHSTNSSHPVLCFSLILGAFVLGCISGVIIILYRMSQENESTTNSVQISTTVDLSVRTKLFESITSSNFVNLNHSIESDDISTAKKLLDHWQTFSPNLSNINQISYEVSLAKYPTSPAQLNQLEILDTKDQIILKIDGLFDDKFRCFSSLLKRGQSNANAIYYANYGRQEDFSDLMYQFKLTFNDQKQSIVVMRRQSNIISQIEQIHQAIHYGFTALIFFDDNQQQIPMTNNRHAFYREWGRYYYESQQAEFLENVSLEKDRTISVLVVSYDDIQRIFSSFQTDSSQWLSSPLEWNNNRPMVLRIGGPLMNFKLRLTVTYEDVNVILPIVMSSIRGNVDPDRFVMIGSRLGAKQQNQIQSELIRIFTKQIQNGWKPKRSILFCAWSGLEFDQYTVRRWFSDNSFTLNKYLISYLDLGNGILSNSTLNLHGSSLLEQIVHDAANSVASPLNHTHSCHHQLTTSSSSLSMNSDQEKSHNHHSRKRKDANHDQETKENCEVHKLLDEWIRASRNQFHSNETLNIVQNIDTDSTAALFQLTYGIPSLLIEMTDEQSLSNDSFYKRYLTSNINEPISSNVYIAYTQFIAEILRQLIDQPLIAFDLKNYADEIDRSIELFAQQFEESYQHLAYHLGDINDFKNISNELTKRIRNIQLHIDQAPRNDFNYLQSFNQQLIDFDRLFLLKEPLPGMNSHEKIYKHMLIGPAFGLSKTTVPFPLLSNILYGLPGDPPGELCEQSRVYSLRLKEQIRFINRTIQGFNGLFN